MRDRVELLESLEIDAGDGRPDHAAGSVREVLEPRVLLDERELGRADRAVALLADDDLGDALGLLVRLPSSSRYCSSR